ncbi:2-hydroxyacyl-CoA dehydratase [Frateuria defendens]|uniref:2-hydroxyacyl-CoA dehydratase n=1 Tax=Frateuria defendens TaxID=2219559 RepID=UPI003016B294
MFQPDAAGAASPKSSSDSMALPHDPFRRFQEELAALDKEIAKRSDKTPEEIRMEGAKAEFLALKQRHKLTIADVVAFFPEEEGIAYLQSLIAAAEAKPKRGRKPKQADEGE